MESYRFQLEKSSKKHLCPACRKRRFVRFIDTEKSEYLPPIYGRCDREANCNYYLSPYADGFANEIQKQEQQNQPGQWKPIQTAAPKPKAPAKPIYIPNELLTATRTRPISKNNFIQNLAKNVSFPFNMEDLNRVINLYQIGTITKGYLSGSTTFPFLDKAGKVRAIQIKQFDRTNHTTQTSFLHSLLETHLKHQKKPLPDWLTAYSQQDKKVSCLFGEHLLPQYQQNPVALVEAPKTCIYASLYFGFPDETPANLLWLSTFNLSSLNKEKIKVLQGRTVVLFPDLSATGKAFDLWSERAQQFSKAMPETRFLVSDLLEQNATEAQRQKGFDLADYLIKQDWRKFRKPTAQQQAPPKLLTPTPTTEPTAKPREQQTTTPPEPLMPETWTPDPPKLWDLSELESFFKNLKHLPTETIRISKAETITNPAKYIQNHLAAVRANNGNKYFEPYKKRLEQLKNILQAHQNPP